MKLLDDNEVVNFSLKDPNYFSSIVEKYEDKLRRYVRRLGRFSTEDIEDILQNTFIATYKNLNGFDQNLSFSSWIYRITHNETISYIRRKGFKTQQRTLDSTDDILEIIPAETDIEKDFDKKELKKKIEEIIQSLPQKYYDALVLYVFEQRSYQEISDILKIPLGTVGTRINRSKEYIKKKLHTNYGTTQ